MERRFAALLCFIVALAVCVGCTDTFGDKDGGGGNNYGILSYASVYDNGEIIGYSVTGIGTYSGTELVIPEKYNGKPVVEIADNAFFNNKQLTYVDMYPSVVRIGDFAFAGCENLRAIGLSENLTSVGLGTFTNCGALCYNTTANGNYLGNDKNPYFLYVGPVAKSQSYTLDGHTKLICGHAFDSDVKTITLPDDLVMLDGYSFVGCKSLEKVIFPETNTKYSFDGGVITDNGGKLILAIGEASLNDKNITSVAPYAFVVYAADSVTLPDTVTTIEDSAFAYCTARTVTFGGAVESIGEGIFYRADDLAVITDFANEKYYAAGNCVVDVKQKAVVAGCKNSVVPTSPDVTSIGKEAFYACGGLTEIIIPENVVKVGDMAFYFCTALKNVTFSGNGLKHVGVNAFTLCSSLENITLPEGTTKIFRYAFSTSGLKTITIPASLTTVEGGAFAGCSQLKTVNYAGSIEQFSAISIGLSNERLTGAEIDYGYTGV